MWPPGMRFAVALTFDVDAEEIWLSEDPANAERPATVSQGTFGAEVALPAVCDLLARHGVLATFFVPGLVAEAHPGRVRAVVEGGHELACHGHTHREPSALSPEEQAEEFRLAREVLDRFGVPVLGYRAPGWSLGPRTLELAAAAGFGYSSNLMDDVRPSVRGDTGLVELPVHWVLDDAPHLWFDAASWDKTIRSAAEVRAIWEEELLGIRDVGGLAVLTMHPQLIGRPGRLRMLDALVGWLLELGDAWVATCAEIAERVRAWRPGERP